MTGTARTLYQTTDGWGDFVVHPDGTIFLTARTGRNKDRTDAYEQQVIGVDPTTGSPKFGVSIYSSEFEESQQLIIAGDGYAYLSHADPDPLNDPGAPYRHLKVLRVATDGTYDDIEIKASWIPVEIYIKFNTITNADQGIVVSWSTCESSGPNVSCNDTNGLAVVTGTTVSLVNAPEVPGQSENVVPVLQAQDGSFVGTAWVALSSWPWSQPAIVAFDPSGNVRWSVPGYEPRIATADGGVIAQSTDPDTGEITSTVMFDKDGNAAGQMAGLPVQSWVGNMYQGTGSGVQAEVAPSIPEADASFWAVAGGNESGTRTAYIQCPCLLQSTETGTSGELAAALHARHSSSVAPDPSGHTYVFVVSAPGIEHNAGRAFVLAAQTASAALTPLGATANSTPPVTSTVSDFKNALLTSGFITGRVTPTTELGMNGPIVGGFTYFGHGGWLEGPGIFESALHLSPLRGYDYNLWSRNLGQLSNQMLDDKAEIVLNACNAGKNKNGATPIAQLLANQLLRTVWAYPVGMYYSADPTPRIIKPVGYKANGTPVYENLRSAPLYMVPNANGVKAIPFYPRVPRKK
jgi:hypothetical protein